MRFPARCPGLAVFICLLFGFTTSAVAATRPALPGADPFYQNASPDPDAKAGDVLASRRAVFTYKREPVPGVRMWQIIFQSENATGEVIAVSGSVLVPTARWEGQGPRPIVGYSVGTRGLGDSCAPSYTLARGTDYEGQMIRSALERGWAVAISDYEGLGTPGTHTYMVGPAEGRAALDVIRAAQRLRIAGLSARAPVGLMGYSQGGHAASWAAELAASYAPELNIRGAAVGGVPGDFAATVEFIDGRFAFGLAMLGAVGVDAAYDDLHLGSYLNERGQELLATADQLCIASVDGVKHLLNGAFTHITDYATVNLLEVPAWQARLAEQELGKNPPTMPVYQYHGTIDEIVPFKQARALRRNWCNSGVNVTWATVPGEHLLGMLKGYQPAANWLHERLTGAPAFGNCDAR